MAIDKGRHISIYVNDDMYERLTEEKHKTRSRSYSELIRAVLTMYFNGDLAPTGKEISNDSEQDSQQDRNDPYAGLLGEEGI